MAQLRGEHFEERIRQFERRDPDLYKELWKKLVEVEPEDQELITKSVIHTADEPLVDQAGAPTTPGSRVVETIVSRNARPVMVIRDNSVTTDFIGPDSQVWANRINSAQGLLDQVIPSVGRIEVNNNPDYLWVGTGWVVSEDILITNRHVAREFARHGPEGFVFRSGLNGGPQIPRVDFLEEYGSAQSLEFTIDSVLWIATPSDPDVAFLRIRKSTFGPPLPTAITLAESVIEDEIVATIGYPARDSRVPDQDLVQRVFGDVYEKKRLAPGQVKVVQEEDLEHDCSTLGGNSGSPVISLASGQAVGLHFAGVFLEGNYAVPAPRVAELLQKALRSELPGMRTITSVAKPSDPADPSNPENDFLLDSGRDSSCTFKMSIPVEVTVRVGGMNLPLIVSAQSQGALPLGSQAENPFEAALRMAKTAVRHRDDVVDVRLGYRFKRGWITDERVVVVEVRKKMDKSALHALGVHPIPEHFGPLSVDVRTAPLQNQLENLGISFEGLERLPRPGAYREPPDVELERVQEHMQAVFHASPDCGFPCLKAFFSRVKRRLTATMYEWEPNHISDQIVAAMHGRGRTVTMVTQRAGTAKAIDDLRQRIGNKLHHVWASIGDNRLIPTAYHIKVASRDGEELWLSSGNWKDSNQPDIDPAGDDSTRITPLRNHNREWHVIVHNPKLATIFQKFVEWDFREAQRVPVEEALEIELPDLFVPEPAFAEPEVRGRGRYFDPLKLDRVIDIQPLLTPDQSKRGKRLYITTAIAMLKRAGRSICIENQSFNLLKDNVDEFEEFFSTLRGKQDAGVHIRIIFRDPREFGQSNAARLDRLLETIKDFGIDTDKIKVQRRCHTKGIIVDQEEVLLGSHNLTNSGALYNRDASLLVRDAEVARYFQGLFEYDWETLAVQEAEELVGGIELAPKGAPTPDGYRRVSAAEVLGLV